MEATERGLRWNWPVLIVMTLLQLWAAHALVFFAHEYAHSFVAWALGWKANPFALNYARPTLKVFLLQLGIDQNVNETPIFANGHGVDAGLIAAAGMVLGNGLITYPLSRWGYASANRKNRLGWALFFYWATLASVGNFIDYVPIRTFADESDMFSVERGFRWSPWLLLVVFGVPAAIALVHFLARMTPEALRTSFPDSVSKRIVLTLLAAFALFAFYGAAGWTDGGVVSHRMSVISVCVVCPLMMVLLAWRSRR